MPKPKKPKKLIRRRTLIFLAVIFTAFAALMIPFLVRPSLELRLSYLFNMRVTMDSLDMDWQRGELIARNLRFHNQEGFIKRPHLFVAELRARCEWKKLLKKDIHIEEVNLYRPVYVIERKILEDGVMNNVVMWWRWIKAHRGSGKDDGEGFSLLSRDRRWKLLIDRINIQDGDFIYHQYGGEKPERKYYFRGIHGYLKGLHWPDLEPEKLDQDVFLKGWVGERFPTPCIVKGRASFATSRISFDLKGTVRNGSVLDYEHLWSGLPITLKGGKYDLDAHVLCLRRDLRSDNLLTLKNLELESRDSLNGTIWGMPMKTWIRFVESEQKLNLNVQLKGEISSPSLRSGEAFNEAFQNALRQKTESGFKFFTKGAVQLAEQTGSIVLETPGLLVNGIEKIASIMPVPLVGNEVKTNEELVREMPELVVSEIHKAAVVVPLPPIGSELQTIKKDHPSNPAQAEKEPPQPVAKEPV
ncbi:MAG: hypothetical protein KBC91_02340 [Candidatus Omnitrophica bacterium]|nr:hypothetical protein [Candidatus Omnitrophota bacterium]